MTKRIEEGAIRFNTDSSKMEVWIGDKWMQVAVSTPNLDGGSRGLFMGGATPSQVTPIDFITISTFGNAQDFGDLTATRKSIDGASSNTRGLFAAGATPSLSKSIDFITIATTGDAADFGDLITDNQHYGVASSSIKAIWAGGYDGSGEGYNLLEFVNIATTGNASAWGDTFRNRKYHAGCSNAHGGITQ